MTLQMTLDISRLFAVLKQTICGSMYPPAPKKFAVDNLTINDVRHILLTEYPHAKLYLLDAKYRVPYKEDVEQVLAELRTTRWHYEIDYQDCDDAAARLWGLTSVGKWASITFGIAISTTHAFNICIADEDTQVYVIEPQYARPKLMKTDNEMYKPIFIMM